MRAPFFSTFFRGQFLISNWSKAMNERWRSGLPVDIVCQNGSVGVSSSRLKFELYYTLFCGLFSKWTPYPTLWIYGHLRLVSHAQHWSARWSIIFHFFVMFYQVRWKRAFSCTIKIYAHKHIALKYNVSWKSFFFFVDEGTWKDGMNELEVKSTLFEFCSTFHH